MFVRSALWFWGRRERTGEGWWIDSAARVESRLCFGAPRSALWPFSVSLSLHVDTRTHVRTHTYTYAHAHTSPGICVCKDTRGLITISACARTRKETKRRNGDAERKEDGMLRNSCTSRTVLDFIGFSRVRFSFSWLALELLFAVGYAGDYDVQQKEL